jgi:hypothetical protein
MSSESSRTNAALKEVEGPSSPVLGRGSDTVSPNALSPRSRPRLQKTMRKKDFEGELKDMVGFASPYFVTALCVCLYV